MKIRQNKNVRVFIWQVFNAFVALAIAFVSGLEGTDKALIATVLYPIITQLSKYINTTYFGDLGVK